MDEKEVWEKLLHELQTYKIIPPNYFIFRDTIKNLSTSHNTDYDSEKDKPSLHPKGEMCPQCQCKDIVKTNDERTLQCLACGFLFEGVLKAVRIGEISRLCSQTM